MQKELGFPASADFSLPLSSGQFRARALTPAAVKELEAIAEDPRLDDSALVREALKRVSLEPTADAQATAQAATDEDLELLAEKLVDHHPWLLEGGAGGARMARRFENEAYAAHFRRALLWHRANPSPAPVAEPEPSALDDEDDDTPSPPSPSPALAPRQLSWALWALIATVALSAAALGLAAFSYFDTRTRLAQSDREQRNAFDAVQQQLNANNEELRRLRQDMQPKAVAAAPEPKAPARPAKAPEPKKSKAASKRDRQKTREKS